MSILHEVEKEDKRILQEKHNSWKNGTREHEDGSRPERLRPF